MIDKYQNQQKRIAFLALHRDLLGHIKQQIGIDVKGYEELCEVVFQSVENLFIKYPMNGDKEEVGVIKTEEIPL